MHRMTVGVAATMVAVACGQPTPEPAPTTTDFVAAPTTEAEASTTLVTEPVDICTQGTVWDAGATYVASCFLLPLSFQPANDGWRSVGAGLEWLEAIWVDPATSEQSIRFGTLAYRPSDDANEVMESILALDGVTPLTEPVATTVGRVNAVTVELETAPDDSPALGYPCAPSLTHGINLGVGGQRGYILLDIDRTSFGLGTCLTFRVWVVEVEDTTITVLATTEDEARFEEMMDVVERLLETTTFGDT